MTSMTTLNHDGLLPMKERHPDWIWNRSDNHVILGVPESPETFKTVVEPGNSYSPGFRSYGVSVWVWTEGRLWAPETMPLEELHWRYADGYLPVLSCEWQAGSITVRTSLHTEGDVRQRNFRTHLRLELHNRADVATSATAHVVIRSFGASGAPLSQLEFRDRDVLANGRIVMTLGTTPSSAGAVSYSETGQDIGQLLRERRRPAHAQVDDPSAWASGSADYDVDLSARGSLHVDATSFVHANSEHLDWLHREPGLPLIPPDLKQFEASWRDRLPLRLELPDPRFAEALQAQATYLAMSTVGVEPRISPVSYPLWWLRDGAFAIVAMELAGLSEWADRAVRSVAHSAPFGGFGAESDGPGQLIWIMTEHHRITGDDCFLADVFPHIRRNADLIVRMRHAREPIFGHTTIRTPQMMLDPSADLMCRPAADGMIQGRMDGHFPRFWVNGWSWFGLRRAIEAGRQLGVDVAEWERQAEDLLGRIRSLMPDHFGENDRDVTGSVWPTGYADPADPIVRRVFDRFWHDVRFAGGTHRPEPEWTYFEACQAHNYVLLGQRDRAWVSIEHFLTRSPAPGLYTQHEGIGDENSSLQWQRSRGWDSIPHVTPHGWTSAALLLLLRDCLLTETRDGALVIGSGIPASWMAHDFAFDGMPSHFGAVSARWSAATNTLSVATSRPVPGGIRSALPLPTTVVVKQLDHVG